jgi:hypothetical protein
MKRRRRRRRRNKVKGVYGGAGVIAMDGPKNDGPMSKVALTLDFFFFFFFFLNGGDEPRAKNALANPMLLARVFRDSRGRRFLFLFSSKMLFAFKLMGSFFFLRRWWDDDDTTKEKSPNEREKRERCAKSTTTRRMYHSRYNYFFFFVSLCTY